MRIFNIPATLHIGGQQIVENNVREVYLANAQAFKGCKTCSDE